MADGQVVLVTTQPLDGGPPVRSVYFVAEQDPEKATAIIAAVIGVYAIYCLRFYPR